MKKVVEGRQKPVKNRVVARVRKLFKSFKPLKEDELARPVVVKPSGTLNELLKLPRDTSPPDVGESVAVIDFAKSGLFKSSVVRVDFLKLVGAKQERSE